MDNNPVVSVTEQEIGKLMGEATWNFHKAGNQTCVGVCTLPNGFEITESAACLDPRNYDQNVGEAIVRERVYDLLWKLEGYRKSWEPK